MVRDEVEALNAVVSKLTRIFRAADTDLSGTVDREEFESLLDTPQMITQLHALGIDMSQALTIFRLCDNDCSGTVSYEEFIGGCLRLKGTAKSADMMTLLYQTEKNQKQLHSIRREMRTLSKQILRMPGRALDANANQMTGESATSVSLTPSRPL